MSVGEVGRWVAGQEDTGGRVDVGPLAVGLANSICITSQSVACVTGIFHLAVEGESTLYLQGDKQRDISLKHTELIVYHVAYLKYKNMKTRDKFKVC